MIFDKMFIQSSILESAMQASEYKNQVILNNIANSDTPGFKAKNIEFEGILNDAVEAYKYTGELNLKSVMPRLKTEHANYSVRLDENNVDIETEMAKFYKNSSKYDVISNSVISNGNRMNTVLTGFR